jgi:hypothetical protein
MYSKKATVDVSFEVNTQNRKLDKSSLTCSDNILTADERSSTKDALSAIMQAFPDDPDLHDFSVYEGIAKLAHPIIDRLHEVIVDRIKGVRVRSFSAVQRDPQYVIPKASAQDFLLHEPGVILDHEDDLFFGRGTEKYFRTTLVQAAYANLVDNVPKLNDNSISNLLDITGFITNLVVHKKVELPKSLSDAWLSYRYQYSTTKMDAQEAIHFLNRRVNLDNIKEMTCYGDSSLDVKGTHVHCKCSAHVSERAVAEVKRVWRALVKYGLTPDFYVIWDMIPYSFVVDWFLPIGDMLARWDADRQFRQHYNIKDINFSLSYYREKDIYDVKCYSRWYSDVPPALQGRYTFERDASSKTLVKRIIDGAALIIG